MSVRPLHRVDAAAAVLSALHLLSASAAVAERRPDPASPSVATNNLHAMWDGVEPEDGSSRIGVLWRRSQGEDLFTDAGGALLPRVALDDDQIDDRKSQSGAAQESVTRTDEAVITGGNIMIVADASSSGYLPLQVGNSWSFVVNAAGVEGRESIESTVRIDGNTYYRFSSFAGKDGPLLRLDSHDRLWERINGRDVLRYDFRAAIGTRWSYPGGVMILEGRDETITTAAGTFARCVKFHYHFDGADGDWDEWYAPGVGPVKRIHYGYAIVDYALESFATSSPN